MVLPVGSGSSSSSSFCGDGAMEGICGNDTMEGICGMIKKRKTAGFLWLDDFYRGLGRMIFVQTVGLFHAWCGKQKWWG